MSKTIHATRVHYRYGGCHRGRSQSRQRLANNIDDVTCGACIRLAAIRDLAARTRCVVAADMDANDVDRAPSY